MFVVQGIHLILSAGDIQLRALLYRWAGGWWRGTVPRPSSLSGQLMLGTTRSLKLQHRGSHTWYVTGIAAHQPATEESPCE